MTEKDSKNKLVDGDQIIKAVNALLQFREKQERKDEFLLDNAKIYMNLTFKLIPEAKNKIIKIPLPTPLTGETSEVCLFVKDLDKRNRDHDKTTEHFENLLSKKGVTNVTQIIPLKALKLEYQPYEAKRNLSNMYDIFLADERIVRLLPSVLGKNFYGKKRHPYSVDLEATDLQGEINQAVSSTRLIISGRGSSVQVTAAHTGMTQEQCRDNVITITERLADTLPGGTHNIKSIHLRLEESPSLPIFISEGSGEDVKLPNIKRKVDNTEPEEVSTIPNKKVKVSLDGAITFYSMEGECLTKVKTVAKKRKPPKPKRKWNKKKKDKTAGGGAVQKDSANEKSAKSSKVKSATPSKEKSAKPSKEKIAKPAKVSSKVMRLAPKEAKAKKPPQAKQQKRKAKIDQPKATQLQKKVATKNKSKSNLKKSNT